MNYPPLVAYDLISDDVREWQVTPVFSSPISMIKIEDDICSKLKKLCHESVWQDDSVDSGENGAVSENHYVLNDELKKYFETSCSSLVRGVLGYDTDVQLTTSWFTKTNEDGSCVEHVHCNSWYSGVVYFDEYDDNSSCLQFVSNSANICPMKTFEFNFLNARTWNVYPSSGLLVLFPSELRHRVVKNKNTKTRYSMAFNVMPKGDTGHKDSFFTY
jgi:uncharacterized protein (TIGR02466 family)